MFLLFSIKVFRDKLLLVLLTIVHCLLILVRLLAPVFQRILPRYSDSSDYRVHKHGTRQTKEKLFCCNVITKSTLANLQSLNFLRPGLLLTICSENAGSLTVLIVRVVL